MNAFKQFTVLFCIAVLLATSGCATPSVSSSSGPTPSPAGKLPGLTEAEFEALLPEQDVDTQMQDCWAEISDGRMGAPSENEWLEIANCVATDLQGATFEPVKEEVSIDTAKYQFLMAVPMLGATLVTPIPGDEMLVLGYLTYQGAKIALLAVSAYGVSLVAADTIIWLQAQSRHSDPQHDMKHTTARTYANIVRANITGPNGPSPDVKCATVLMATGAIRYAIMVPTHTYSGKAILAWFEGSSWGGAYRIRVSEFPETLTRGVEYIAEIACNQLPPPPGVLTP